MANGKYTILVVDPDPMARGLLAEGYLEGSGLYETITAGDGGEALTLAVDYMPDLVIMEMNLPGFSGKDLMVALLSQGIETPVITITEEGGEHMAIEAFRLGAKDYLVKPLREAEVYAVVERVLEEVTFKREREQMTQEIADANQALEQRLSEERTLFAIGKAVTSRSDLNELLNLIVEAGLYLTNAETCAVVQRDDQSGAMMLQAGKNLPPHLANQMGSAIGDDLASLVMTSGEPLLASGEGLRRFNPPHDSYSVIYVPMVVAQRAIGILWVGNRSQQEFVERQKELLTALADYAAIAVVNVRLFQMLDQRARRMEQVIAQLQEQQSAATSAAGGMELAQQMVDPLQSFRYDLSLLRSDQGVFNAQQEASLDVMDRKVGEMLQTLDTILNEDGDG